MNRNNNDDGSNNFEQPTFTELQTYRPGGDTQQDTQISYGSRPQYVSSSAGDAQTSSYESRPQYASSSAGDAQTSYESRPQYIPSSAGDIPANNNSIAPMQYSQHSYNVSEVSEVAPHYWEQPNYHQTTEHLLREPAAQYHIERSFQEYKEVTEPYEDHQQQQGGQTSKQYMTLQNLDPADTDVYVMKENAHTYSVGKSQSQTSAVGGEGTLGSTLASSLNLISNNEVPVQHAPAAPQQTYTQQYEDISPEQPSIPRTLLVPPLTPDERDIVKNMYRDNNTNSGYSDTYTSFTKDLEGIPHPVVEAMTETPRSTRSQASRTSTPADELAWKECKMRTIIVPKKEIGNLSKLDESVELHKNLNPSQEALTDENSVVLYQCQVCNKMFHRKQTLRQHFIVHTDRFPCPHCSIRCKSKGDLRSHIQTHTKEKPYHCNVCGTNYTRESILRKHQTTLTHIKNAREYARNAPKVEGGFEPGKHFYCKVCHKSCKTLAELRMHKRKHLLKFKCTVCSKRCMTESMMRIHMKSHDNKHGLSCKECSRSFPNIFLLKEHVRSHKRIKKEIKENVTAFRPEDPPPPVIEKQQRHEMPSLSEINSYMPASKPHRRQKQKSREAKFSCHLCGKEYINRKSLETHENVHHKYNCVICEKKFPSLSNLKVHMKIHGKPYKCDVCESPFFDQQEFKEHMLRHNNPNKDVKCKICYSEFESNADLQIHMQNHAPTMLFSGASLDDSSIPVYTKKEKGVKYENFKFSDSEGSSDYDVDGDDDNGNDGENENRKKNKKDLFNREGFLEILGNVIVDLTSKPEDLHDEEDSESGDELVSAIQSIIDTNILDSEESDENEEATQTTIYTESQILETHRSKFASYTDIKDGDDKFMCTLCSTGYTDQSLLQQHFVNHICHLCNIFFENLQDCRDHIEEHKLMFINKIKQEAASLDPTIKYELFSSDSEEEEEDVESDGFLSEMEQLLDCLPRPAPTGIAPHQLSHDEIIRHNKRTFEKYSCIDAASGIYACTICKRKYARPTTLTRHFKTHVCLHCNEFFEDKGDLQEHKLIHKSEGLSPEERLKRGNQEPPISKVNRDLFKKFSFVDTEHNINRCTLCNKNFVRRTVLTRHMKTHICGHCDKFYEDKYDLAKHVLSHNNDFYAEADVGEEFVGYDADDDEKGFAVADSRPKQQQITFNQQNYSTGDLSHVTPAFLTHQTTGIGADNQITYIQIPDTEPPPVEQQVVAPPTHLYTTTPGGETFQIISEPDHNGDPESFLVAPASINTSAVLENRKLLLSQPHHPSLVGGSPGDDNEDRRRLFECGDCGKRFLKNAHLKSHMLTHSGDKPFSCRLCGKSFSRSTTLRKHEKTHLKRCKICDSTFNYKYELDVHMEIHRTYSFYK